VIRRWLRVVSNHLPYVWGVVQAGTNLAFIAIAAAFGVKFDPVLIGAVNAFEAAVFAPVVHANVSPAK
jgi:hypothetical protein